jgi:hypothetical protein
LAVAGALAKAIDKRTKPILSEKAGVFIITPCVGWKRGLNEAALFSEAAFVRGRVKRCPRRDTQKESLAANSTVRFSAPLATAVMDPKFEGLLTVAFGVLKFG